MSDPDESPPQADQVDGAPHPRDTRSLVGQVQAEADFLAASQGGRLHHAWLLIGPQGVGKATFAWRAARHLLADPPDMDGGAGLFGDAPVVPTLDTNPESPVNRRISQLAEPRLALVRRSWDDKAKRHKTAITVDDVRRLKSFFGLSAADGGWRVAIVDAADEMNTAAANALLKLLEEPPERTVFLLIGHRPARLLPTIRSRCRTLRFQPLNADDLATALSATGTAAADPALLHHLSGGSVGAAIRLQDAGGTDLYPQIVSLLSSGLPLDRPAITALASKAAGRSGDVAYRMISDLALLLLSRLARASAATDNATLLDDEAPLIPRLVPGLAAARQWAAFVQEQGERLDHARAVNLDPEHVILDMFLRIEKTASGIAQRAA